MRRAAKADSNQPEIVAALRAAGATVQHLHQVGRGCPDIAVGYRGFTYFLEIKTQTGSLTDDEEDWHDSWRGQAAIVRSADEALAVIGAIE